VLIAAVNEGTLGGVVDIDSTRDRIGCSWRASVGALFSRLYRLGLLIQGVEEGLSTLFSAYASPVPLQMGGPNRLPQAPAYPGREVNGHRGRHHSRWQEIGGERRRPCEFAISE
jgi:hypothetical protein